LINTRKLRVIYSDIYSIVAQVEAPLVSRDCKTTDAEPNRWVSKDSQGFGAKRTFISKVRTPEHFSF